MMETYFEHQSALIKVWAFTGVKLNASCFLWNVYSETKYFLIVIFFKKNLEYLSNQVAEYLQSNSSGLTGGNLIIQERDPAQYHPNFLCED